MYDNNNNLLHNIDQNLDGLSLSSDLVTSFESAFIEFKDTFNPDSSESKEKLDEMVRLLTINDKNLERVKNQKWFQRPWRTISGKNKKLEKINAQNLYEIHKGSIYFLQMLANHDKLMMRSVLSALKRIDDIQIANEHLKIYLLRIIDRYDLKLKEIDEKLNKNASDIEVLKTDNRWVMFFISMVIIGGATLLYYVFEKNWIIYTSIVGLLLLGILFLKKSFVKTKGRGLEHNNSPKINKIKIKNDELKPILKDNLRHMLHSFIWKGPNFTMPFFERHFEFLKLYNQLDFNKNDSATNILDKALIISFDLSQLIRLKCSNDVSELIKLINLTIIKSIIDDLLPDSIGLDLRAQVDHQGQTKFFDEILSAIEPHFETLNEIEKLRNSLYSSYPRYRKILAQNKIKREIMDIFTDSISDFNNNFYNKFIKYKTKLDDFAETIGKSVIPFQIKIQKVFMDEVINNMECIFEEFTKNGSSLVSLNNYILEGIESLEKYREDENED